MAQIAVDADTKEYSVQRVVNVRTVPIWGCLMTQVKRICTNSSKRRIGNKGGESEDEQRQEPGEKEVNWEQGCPGTTVSLEEEVDGIMDWVFGSNNMDSIEDCEYNTPLA